MDVQHRVQVEHEQKGNGRDGGVHTSKLGGSLPESKRTATGEQQMWAPRSGQEADDGGHSSPSLGRLSVSPGTQGKSPRPSHLLLLVLAAPICKPSLGCLFNMPGGEGRYSSSEAMDRNELVELFCLQVFGLRGGITLVAEGPKNSYYFPPKLYAICACFKGVEGEDKTKR